MRHQIVGMVPLKPETEFPQTRGMQRHFILHVGPTNCGKTYHALERLKRGFVRSLSWSFASSGAGNL